MNKKINNVSQQSKKAHMVTTKPAVGMPRWQELEKLVRMGAELKFGATARAEDISGVKCDCVLDLHNGMVVLIEITKENVLEKLRTDLAKFAILRHHFFGKDIFPLCYFLTLNDPTPSIIEAGKANHVKVLSWIQFMNSVLSMGSYQNIRLQHPFGSAIDLYSGKPDQRNYVRVDYFSDKGEAYSTEKIASELLNRKTVILIGDYGSGKSRCVKEVFGLLADDKNHTYTYPIAINLRDNWGLKRAVEIITRHFTDLGLGDNVPDVLKVCFSIATTYLLDGFDEIGAQTWSDDPSKLVSIRRESLVGVKDLINRASGGILITGREHYFNDDAELLTCLGLESKNTLMLRCNQQLTDEQFTEMVGYPSLQLPRWTPKKPLIAAIIRDIEPETVDNILNTSSGQIDFWNLLIETFCEREARINPILDASIIRSLYTKIGRLSRTTKSVLGPISIKQINEAFEQTTGRPPTDESAIILQRLPGLSRIGAESLDRQFIDTYILDGLKAEDVLGLFILETGSWLNEKWLNPVEEFGAFYIANRINDTKQVAAVCAFLLRHRDCKNRVFLSDLLSALFRINGDSSDLNGLEFSGGQFYHISIADTSVKNVICEDCTFNFLDITDAEPDRLSIRRSIILKLAGVTAKEHLPAWVSECEVENFQAVNTLTAIREAGLSIAQTFLLSSLRKLFLQPGGGRMESSMYKGFGDAASKRTCEKVIGLLVREGFCNKVKGESGSLFIPDRSKTGRVRAITNQMTTSKDPLWLAVNRIL